MVCYFSLLNGSLHCVLTPKIEIEYTILLGIDKKQAQSSAIGNQHVKDVNVAVRRDSPFRVAIDLVHQALTQHFNTPQLESGIADLMRQAKANGGSTPRRFELGLLQAGKVSFCITC